jgi:hypothetical protein
MAAAIHCLRLCFAQKQKSGTRLAVCALGNRRDKEWLALATGTLAAAIVLVQALVGDRLVGGDPQREEGRPMHIERQHWLEYDPVAFAALVIGISIIELLALII